MADRKRLLKLPVEDATLEADGVALAEDRMLRPAIHSLSHDPSAGRPMFIYIYVVRDDMSDGPATMWTGPKKANQGMPLAQH